MNKKFVPIITLLFLTVIRCAVFYHFQKDWYSQSKNSGYYIPIISKFNAGLTKKVRSVLPSTDADLLLGMTIGVDTIKSDTRFYQMLIQVGVVHVVVVSGYNVALVMKFVSNIFYEKLKSQNKIIILVFLLAYTLLCGAQPPVIRAALMGYISYLAMAEGRRLEGELLLIAVCLVMILVFPLYLVSLSFWLSTGSTFGLMFFESFYSACIKNYLKDVPAKALHFLPTGDLSTSLACQTVVWPLISYFFGRISLISPLYNMLLLWLIPLCTVCGFIFLILLSIFPFAAVLLSMLVLPFYDMFARGVELFSFLDPGSAVIKIPLWFLILYYILLSGVAIYTKKYKKTCEKIS